MLRNGKLKPFLVERGKRKNLMQRVPLQLRLQPLLHPPFDQRIIHNDGGSIIFTMGLENRAKIFMLLLTMYNRNHVVAEKTSSFVRSQAFFMRRWVVCRRGSTVSTLCTRYCIHSSPPIPHNRPTFINQFAKIKRRFSKPLAAAARELDDKTF